MRFIINGLVLAFLSVIFTTTTHADTLCGWLIDQDGTILGVDDGQTYICYMGSVVGDSYWTYFNIKFPYGCVEYYSRSGNYLFNCDIMPEHYKCYARDAALPGGCQPCPEDSFAMPNGEYAYDWGTAWLHQNESCDYCRSGGYYMVSEGEECYQCPNNGKVDSNHLPQLQDCYITTSSTEFNDDTGTYDYEPGKKCYFSGW